MSTDLQQVLHELQGLFDGGDKAALKQRLTKAKVRLYGLSAFTPQAHFYQIELAQSGLYFAPQQAKPEDLSATRMSFTCNRGHPHLTQALFLRLVHTRHYVQAISRHINYIMHPYSHFTTI
jgi:hypothetical protein